MRFYVFLVLWFVFLSLSLNAQTRIYITEPYGNNFVESELIDEVTFVPLEIKKYGQISPEMEMKVIGDNYFILDHIKTQCIYRFGGDGKLRNTICEKKHENAEDIPVLVNPAKFNVDIFNNLVELYNFEESVVKRFDFEGNLKGTVKFSMSPADFVRTGNNEYWIYTGWNNSETQYRLLKTDSKGTILDRKMRLISKCFPTESFAFHPTKEKILFWEQLGTAVYSIQNDKIIPEYIFNFGSYALPRDYHMMLGEDSYSLINGAGFFSTQKYLENKDFAYFFVLFKSNTQQEMFHVISDKANNQVMIFAENSAIKAFGKAQHITDDNELLFLVSPRSMSRLFRSSVSDFIPAPFVGLTDELKPFRNPVVLKIKLKSLATPKTEDEATDNEQQYFGN